MQRASLETVQAELPKLLAGLGQQEQLIIVQRGKPVATVREKSVSKANIAGLRRFSLIELLVVIAILVAISILD